ncbi:bifunctional diguanylate cyclase/phosphodiesterase [Halomonas sp. LS-001]
MSQLSNENRRSQRRAIALYCLALLVMVMVFAGLLIDQYHQELRVAHERNATRADLIAEWVQTTFVLSEYMLLGVAQLRQPPLASQMTEQETLAAVLTSRRESLPLISDIALMDRHGSVIASTHSMHARGFDAHQLPFFQQLEETEAEQYISPLFWSASRQDYRIMHSLKLHRSNGQFDGVVAVQLSPAVFDDTLNRLTMRKGESMAIMDSEGRLVARRPSELFELGMLVNSNAEVESFLSGDARQQAMRINSPVDGEERLYWMKRLDGLPFSVVVGDSTQQLLAGWWQRLWILGLIASVIMLLGAWILRHYVNRLQLSEQLQQRVQEREEARAQAQEHEAELRIAATAFQSHLGMVITDALGRILKVNDTFTKITGYREDEVLGENPRMLSSGRHSAAFYKALWQRVAEKGSWEGEIWNRRKNGQVFPEWLTISAVKDNEDHLTHYVATLSDISERKTAEQEIHQLAFYDPLTGLANRRLFLDRMETMIKDIERQNKQGALLFIDLDNFKQVNDTLGHYAGDRLLQRMARELTGVLRDTDTLARLGGDEFAVLIENLGESIDQTVRLSESIAHKLMTAIRRPIEMNNETVLVTGSIGITLIDGSVNGVDGYLQQADMALFQAKEAGRDTLSFFDPAMQAALINRARLETDLRQALDNHQWRLEYQPQVDRHGMLIGVEALLRWRHPLRGTISPADFIPLLESTRLINEVGNWVLETACQQLVKWQKRPETAHLNMAVNISPVQFREDSFVPKVLSILRRTGAPADKLKLEVTETLFLDSRDDAQRKMAYLRNQGVRFSLDDFGTGYSSLSYLAHLPLDQLKIDQSFVREVLGSEANAAIVASTIALAKTLELSVIAEGVETEAQQRWLAEHGCLAYQGYLFGQPMDVAEIEALI